MRLIANKERKEYSTVDEETQLKLARTTYLILLGITLFLFFFHLFKLYDFRIDKFSYFIITLLFLILIIPLITYFKAFGIVEVRKDTRFMGKK
ncbi:MAG: hypothetical protein ACP5OZ_04010 [Candidatus Woesearchaeota archaeon]